MPRGRDSTARSTSSTTRLEGGVPRPVRAGRARDARLDGRRGADELFPFPRVERARRGRVGDGDRASRVLPRRGGDQGDRAGSPVRHPRARRRCGRRIWRAPAAAERSKAETCRLAGGRCGARARRVRRRVGVEPPAKAPASTSLPNFTHVVVVVFENHEATGSRATPTPRRSTRSPRRYAHADDYDGVTHPSLPNYLALVSGSTHGITSDCVRCVVDARNLADTLAAPRKDVEDVRRGSPVAGLHRRRARATTRRSTIRSSTSATIADHPARARNVVPLPRLVRDVAARKLPDFSLVVPNLCNDMHDCSVATGDAWLKRAHRPARPLARARRRGRLRRLRRGHDRRGRRRARLRARARPDGEGRHSVFARATNHYGLLRTIEDAWHLPRLGLSARGTPIGGIWKG